MLSMSLRLTGTRALLMHHGRLADPRHEVTRAIRDLGREKQTAATREKRQKLEWLGGLYTDHKQQIIIMEDMVLGAGVEGAAYIRRQKEMRAAVLGAAPYWPLEYEGPKGLEELYASGKFLDYRGVRTSQGRVMRTRPRFDEWSIAITVLVDESILDPRDVLDAFSHAGRLVGIGDFRPRYGRFQVELI